MSAKSTCSGKGQISTREIFSMTQRSLSVASSRNLRLKLLKMCFTPGLRSLVRTVTPGYLLHTEQFRILKWGYLFIFCAVQCECIHLRGGCVWDTIGKRRSPSKQTTSSFFFFFYISFRLGFFAPSSSFPSPPLPPLFRFLAAVFLTYVYYNLFDMLCRSY